MKKLLIGMLITCSLGLAACGTNNAEDPSTKNNSGTGVTDGTNGTNNGPNNGANNEANNGMNNGANGTGVSDNTNPNANGTNNQGASVNDSRTSINDLYTEFKGKVEGGIENIKTEDWDKYSSEFKGKLTNARNTIQDASIKSTVDDMENLFNEYDTAIRQKTDVAKDKVEEMRNRIENALK
ncbi:hypothetical protein [Clostridium sp.]|uniref:hypothetical protein n=1 Tax=Clostridium sp. TaxID=1506 RepID=UPI0025C07792|nr:hypothetical protein [Clostridium sp.]